MKKLTLTMVGALITSITFAQKVSDKDVPVGVKSSFQKQYPNVEETKWEIENSNYEAEFEINETDYSVVINPSGNILETEIEINVNELPANMKEYISKNYAGKKVKEAAKIIDATGMVVYEAEIKGMDLIFDSKGKFIKEVKN